jgi:hypothetical protein
MEAQKIKDFVKKFFINSGCDVLEEGDILNVSNVSPKFEKFFGKNSPYKFVFENEDEGCDFITKGSVLIKTINEFLENKGKTTLLKINFNHNLEEEIKKRFPLMNCEISHIKVKNEYESFIRFSFLTVFQYLNEREQVVNSICIKDKGVVNFDFEKYDLVEGNKGDVNILGIEGDYALSKEHLKILLQGKLEGVKNNLKLCLDKETKRIEEHFESQVGEILGEIEKSKNQIENFSRKLETVGFEEKDILEKKIINLKNLIEKLESSDDLVKAKKEEEFFLKDELRKHSLEIKNKLMNTTIIYYPVFVCDFFLKSGSGKRMVQIKFNPMENKFSKLNCNSCGLELSELILCSSGHLTCRLCGDKCGCCGEVFCKSCFTKVCEKCEKKICGKCSLRCGRCGKFMCKSHGKMIDGKNFVCKDCMVVCGSCGKLTDPNDIKRDNLGRKLCIKCYGEKVGKKTIEGIFGG